MSLGSLCPRSLLGVHPAYSTHLLLPFSPLCQRAPFIPISPASGGPKSFPAGPSPSLSCLGDHSSLRLCTACSLSSFCCSVAQSCLTLQPQGLQHTRPPCPSLSPWVCSNSYPLSRWCHPIISLSVVPFFCPQYFPASGSFLKSQLFAPGGQSIGDSASASVLTMNIQGWFPLGLTGLISFHSKGPSRIFSSITIPKYQFFGAQPFLWFNSHICTWLLEKPWLWLFQQSDVFAFNTLCRFAITSSGEKSCLMTSPEIPPTPCPNLSPSPYPNPFISTFLFIILNLKNIQRKYEKNK